MQTTYINQLPGDTQKAIKEELVGMGLSMEDIECAMDSRLCDLEDTIDITKFL
jgi:hypothetical protein